MPEKRERPNYQSAFNTYTVIRELGKGGSGAVYEVSDVDSQRYALKVIDPGRTSSQKLKRFKNETIFCLGNKHKNIVTVIDHGRGPAGEPFYVMPLYPFTLQTVMTEGIDHCRVLPIFSQLLDGVEAAHFKGITHRDLKPQNILCDSAKSTFVIADFGIATFEEEDLYTIVETRQADRLANFQYAAPEQRARGRTVAHRADVYALGLILNEMFTGEVLQGTGFRTIASLAPDYSYLDPVVENMVRQDPDQRPVISEVKKQLLARQEQFVSLQKIDQLTREVVPEQTIDDPLVRNPITLKAVDYQAGELFFTLSQNPNPEWIDAFHQQGNFSSFLGEGPRTVSFVRSIARIRSQPAHAQQQIDWFKEWLASANSLYAERVSRETALRRREERLRLEEEISAERERQDVLSRIKW